MLTKACLFFVIKRRNVLVNSPSALEKGYIMSNYELFEQMIENRIFIENMDLDLLKKSSSILKKEYQRRFFNDVFSVLYPCRIDKRK